MQYSAGQFQVIASNLTVSKAFTRNMESSGDWGIIFTVYPPCNTAKKIFEILKCQNDFQCGLWFFYKKNIEQVSDDLLHLLSRLSLAKIHTILSFFFFKSSNIISENKSKFHKIKNKRIVTLQHCDAVVLHILHAILLSWVTVPRLGLSRYLQIVHLISSTECDDNVPRS